MTHRTSAPSPAADTAPARGTVARALAQDPPAPVASTAAPVAPDRVAHVGVDVGGTKTHVAVRGTDGTRFDTVLPSADWRRGMLFDDPGNLPRLAAAVDAVAPGCWHTAVVIGMHGLDTEAQCADAASVLRRSSRGRVEVVNDAALLGPAAGHDPCITLVVGTGAVARGVDAHGTVLTADGYNALLGDDGSAPALVREATRAAMRSADRHGPGAALADPMVAALCRAYGVGGVTDLALAVTTDDPYRWGRHAPLVFEALGHGSPLAHEVVAGAAATLAGNVAALKARGALGDVVVGAGAVLTGQASLRDAVLRHLDDLRPGLTLHLLQSPPVDGALALAARL